MSGDGPSVFLIGAGRMGGALLRGWLAAGISSENLSVAEPSPSPEIAALLKSQNIAALPEKPPGVMVLAVKPQVMEEVLTKVKAAAAAKTVILSIAAGRTIESIAKHFPQGQPIIRAIPNLPAEIGRGITAAIANSNVSEEQRGQCDRLLGTVGKVVWVADESLIDAVTAVSGSGPAYVFHLVECLADAAQKAGLPFDLAMELARTTVTGAGELLHRSPLSAEQLRENVTSPAGTTAAGLSVLMSSPGLRELMIEAVAAAARRSRELSQ